MTTHRSGSAGFTLLEILVSISIIGVLSSVLYLSFSSARDSATDKAIMTELKEVQLALELYAAQAGQFPAAGASWDSVLTPDFIAAVPTAADSRNPNCTITYETDTNQTWYKLTAAECIAGDTTIADVDELARCPTTCSSCDGTTINTAYLESDAFAKSVAVYSLGGQCE